MARGRPAMRVAVTGGTGFIGSRLCARLLARGDEVVVLTRDAARAGRALPPGARAVAWGRGAAGWEASLDGAGAVVNLAGESVARRWTTRAKQRIVRSRIEAAERLHGAIQRARVRPDVVVNASAVGYYGPRGDETLTEDSPPGHDFLAQTCVEWEAAARRLEGLGARVVRVRIGLVLGQDGGALARMLLPFRVGLGGPIGSGRQWISWIHRDDLVELIAWAVDTAAVSGAVNGTTPDPVRMREFARTLGRVLGRPALVPVPAPLVRLGLGEAATIVLDGQRVLPARALALGFAFRHPDLEPALRAAIGA